MEEVKLFGITPRGAHYMVNMQTKNDETLKNLEELLTKPKIREQLDAYAYDLDLKKSRVRYLSGILEDGVTHFTLELCKMPEEKLQENIGERLQYLWENFLISAWAEEWKQADVIFREYQAVRKEQMDLKLK